MKKTICILLTLLLALTLLPAGALAAGETAIASPRALRVDGKLVRCEVYEIGGEAWFRLRDVALALNRTGSRFSVGWDAGTRTVLLTTGEAYVSDGSEESPRGDLSATAVPAGQTVCIDGEEVTGLPAWNVGGNNYFRLADLASALGFQADYDEASDTAIIRAKAYYEPRAWLTEELFFYDESGSRPFHHEIATYDSAGRPLTNFSEGVSILPGAVGEVRFQTSDSFYYDELGRRKEYVTDHMNGDGPLVSGTFEYDAWGQLVYNGGGENSPGSGTAFTYDDRGNLTALEQIVETPMGEMVMGSYSEYDENDRLIRSVTLRDGVTLSSSEYAYDEEGHTWRQANYDAEGNLAYAFSYVYENGALLRTVQDNGAYSVVTTYEVDEESGTRTTVTESPSGVTKTVVTVDEAGRPLRQETISGDTVSLTVYEYDEAGRLLRQTVGDPEAPDSQRICTYDDQGNLLTDVYEERGGYREEIVCEYDYAARKKTETRTTTRPEG